MKKIFLILVLTFITAGVRLYSQPPAFDDDDPGIMMDNMEDDDGMPPPDGDGPPMMMRNGRMMSEERIEKIMNFITEKHPEFGRKMMMLKGEHPEIFIRTIHKLRKFVRNSRKGPEDKDLLINIFDEEIDLDILMERYFLEKDTQKKEMLKSDIIKKMSVLFDKKEKMKLDVIRDIENNLQKRKAEAEKRKKDKEKILNKDFDIMLKSLEKAGSRK